MPVEQTNKNAENDDIKDIEHLFAQQSREQLHQEMHDAAAIDRVVMLNLWQEDIPHASNRMVVIDRSTLEHELIHKVIVVERREHIEHKKCQGDNDHHGWATMPQKPLGVEWR